ncbi:MAG TPA: hypothetical protein VGK20_07105 [Candidatus Binatia bacterium]|jgi:hypothetical protein
MARRGVESALVGAFQELSRIFGESRVVSAAGHLAQGAAQTRDVVDSNVAAVLGLAGLPSRRDVQALRRQLDVMQVTLANLSRKLDRVIEEQAASDSSDSAAKHTRKRATHRRGRPSHD